MFGVSGFMLRIWGLTTCNQDLGLGAWTRGLGFWNLEFGIRVWTLDL